MCKRAYQCESGFSLVELLLSIGVLSLMVLGIMQVTHNWAQQRGNEQDAAYLIKVNVAAQSYAGTNFDAIMETGFGENIGDTNGDDTLDNNDLINVGRAIQIPIEDDGGPFYLKDGTASISLDFPDTTPSGREAAVYIRNLGYIDEKITLEVFTVTDGRAMDALRARSIARAIGPEGGLYTGAGGCGGSFEGVYGNWILPEDSLSGSAMMSGNPDYCPDAGEAGQNLYVALQGRVTGDGTISDEYLYRVSVPGRPELNRMETNIDLQGQAVINAGYMTADNVQVGGSMNATGDPAQTVLYVDQALRMAGSGHEFQDIRVVNDLPGGSADLSVTSLSANNATLTSANMSLSGGLSVEQSMGITGNAVARTTLEAQDAFASAIVANDSTPANPIETPILQVASDVAVDNFTSGLMTAEAFNAEGAIAASSIAVVNDMGVGGNATLSGGFSAEQFQSGILTRCQATVEHRYPYGDGDFYEVAPYDCTGDGPND